MTLYQYHCIECDHVFDSRRERHEAIIHCPKCGALANREITAPYLKTESGVKC
jgi:putative FmdB family regulatory protein